MGKSNCAEASGLLSRPSSSCQHARDFKSKIFKTTCVDWAISVEVPLDFTGKHQVGNVCFCHLSPADACVRSHGRNLQVTDLASCCPLKSGLFLKTEAVAVCGSWIQACLLCDLSVANPEPHSAVPALPWLPERHNAHLGTCKSARITCLTLLVRHLINNTEEPPDAINKYIRYFTQTTNIKPKECEILTSESWSLPTTQPGMVPWCWEKKGRPCVWVCALGQGRRFACRQTCSHACSGSSRLVAFWLCRVMGVCHRHRAEKHGLEASGDRDLVVIRRELLPEQTLCGLGICVYLESISSALFISDRGGKKKKNQNQKVKAVPVRYTCLLVRASIWSGLCGLQHLAAAQLLLSWMGWSRHREFFLCLGEPRWGCRLFPSGASWLVACTYPNVGTTGWKLGWSWAWCHLCGVCLEPTSAMGGGEPKRGMTHQSEHLCGSTVPVPEGHQMQVLEEEWRNRVQTLWSFAPKCSPTLERSMASAV